MAFIQIQIQMLASFRFINWFQFHVTYIEARRYPWQWIEIQRTGLFDLYCRWFFLLFSGAYKNIFAFWRFTEWVKCKYMLTFVRKIFVSVQCLFSRAIRRNYMKALNKLLSSSSNINNIIKTITKTQRISFPKTHYFSSCYCLIYKKSKRAFSQNVTKAQRVYWRRTRKRL